MIANQCRQNNCLTSNSIGRKCYFTVVAAVAKASSSIIQMYNKTRIK